MQAVWNAIETKAMSHDENLLNTCRQLEQEYIDWRRPMTHGGSYITRLWPAVGNSITCRASLPSSGSSRVPRAPSASMTPRASRTASSRPCQASSGDSTPSPT